MKTTLIALQLLLCLTVTVSANEMVLGTYKGKFKESVLSGPYTLVIKEVSDSQILGTVKFGGSVPCRKTMVFSAPNTGDGHMVFSVDTQTGCGITKYDLIYEDAVINGTYIDAHEKGKIVKLKLKN